MALLVLAHIDTGHHGLVVEEELREGLCQFRLTHARCAQEEEGTDGPVLVAEPRTAAANRIRHSPDGLVLTNDPLVEFVLHPQELFLFALHHAVHRDARPPGHHFGNVLRRNGFSDNRILDRRLLGLEFLDAFAGLRDFSVAQFSHTSVIALALGDLSFVLIVFYLLACGLQLCQKALLLIPTLGKLCLAGLEFLKFGLDLFRLKRGAFALHRFLLYLQLTDLGIEDVDRLRHRIHLQTQLACSLVHQVDSLVRQEPVVDVAVAEVHRGDEGVILDAHLVVVLVLLLKSTQYGDALCGRRFVHHNLLETAFQCLVLLEILLVLVQGGGSDGAQLATGQRRLQYVAGVHCARRPACTHQGVDFINEKDNLSFAFHHFLHHAFQPFLELSLILSSRDEGAHVQGEDLAVLEVFRYLPVYYLAGDAFGNSGLAHTGFAHQDRIVLGAARQYLENTADFVVPPDHGIQFAFRGGLVEVDCKLAQKFIFVIHKSLLCFPKKASKDIPLTKCQLCFIPLRDFPSGWERWGIPPEAARSRCSR